MISVDVVFAAPSELGQADHELDQTPQIAAHELTIPSEFGTIEESYQGTNGKTIIYIQDAHDSLDAQENIAKMIDHLAENIETHPSQYANRNPLPRTHLSLWPKNKRQAQHDHNAGC